MIHTKIDHFYQFSNKCILLEIRNKAESSALTN